MSTMANGAAAIYKVFSNSSSSQAPSASNGQNAETGQNSAKKGLHSAFSYASNMARNDQTAANVSAQSASAKNSVNSTNAKSASSASKPSFNGNQISGGAKVSASIKGSEVQNFVNKQGRK